MPSSTGDLAQKSSAAAAAAQAGSALQQVNCLQMQADAQAEEDPNAQAWKQLAAGMQCQQAQQSQQAAQQNQDNSKKLGGTDIPKQASFTAGTVSLGNSGVSEPQINSPTPTNGSPNDNAIADPVIAPIGSQSKAVAESTSATDTSAGVNVPLDIPVTALNPISPGSLVTQDTSTSVAPGAGSTNGRGFYGGAGSTSGTNSSTASTASVESDIAAVEKSLRVVPVEAGASSGDSEAPSKSSGILDALMAQLNPENGGAPTGLISEGAAQIASAQTTDSGKVQRVNIFEYASYRYQLASQDRIGRQPKRDLLSAKPPLSANLNKRPVDLLSTARH